MTPAEALRGRVVTLVLWGVLTLAAGLYLLVGVLLYRKGADSVPDALWLAAGAASQAIYGWLNNSKGQDSVQPVQVVNEPADPVPTTPAEPYTSEFGHIDAAQAALLTLVTACGLVLGTLLLRWLG